MEEGKGNWNHLDPRCKQLVWIVLYVDGNESVPHKTCSFNAAQNFPARHNKPAIFFGSPLPPSLCDSFQLLCCGDSLVYCRLCELGLGDSVGPQSRPPEHLVFRGITPAGRGAFDARTREPGLTRPGVKLAAGVGLSVVGSSDRQVDLAPAVQSRGCRIPGERGVVGIASRDYAAWFCNPLELPQSEDGVADVLQSLMRMHNIELPIFKRQSMGVADFVRDICCVLLVACLLRLLQDCRLGIQSHHGAFGHQQGQVCRDRPGSASHVQNAHVGLQVGQQVRAAVGRRAPCVAAEHGGVMTMRVAFDRLRCHDSSAGKFVRVRTNGRIMRNGNLNGNRGSGGEAIQSNVRVWRR